MFLEFLPTCVFLTFRHLDFVLFEFGLCFFLACVSCVWVPFCLTVTVSTIRNTYRDITGADKNRFWTKIKIKMIAWSPLGESVQKFCASAPICVIHCIFSLSMTSDFWLGRWAQLFRQMWSEEHKRWFGLFGSSSAPGIRYWRTERSQWLVLIGRDFFLPACMQPFTGSAWWHCQTGAEGEKNKHKQADTDWFSCVVMQSSTNSSVLSLPCKYLTDSYNSSPASAAHLNLFKSWTMSDWQLHTRAKKAACPGACKPQSLVSDISC